jgi:tetratricopeptide (TPR) repeat protein
MAALIALCALLQDATALYNEGCRLAKEDKHAEALAKFEEALKIAPKDADALYNGALSAYLADKPARSAELWVRLIEVEPNDLMVRAKLVQAYHAAKETAKRDEARKKLFEMRAALPEAERRKQTRYSRDQFLAGPKSVRVVAYEYYELTGDRAVRYLFSVKKDGGSRSEEDYTISLGSYEATTKVAREQGEIGPDARLFHLDGYFDGGTSHKTYGFFKTEPTYDEAAKMVVEILEGKRGEPKK